MRFNREFITQIAEEVSEEDMDPKVVAPQLVLAAQALGLDPHSETDLEKFMHVLKALATTKAQKLKSAMTHWSSTKATKAVRTAKASID